LFNRLVKVTRNDIVVAEYLYDESGLRIKKQGTNSATYYTFDTGGNVLYEQEGKIYTRYVYVNGQHFARIDGNLDNGESKKYFIHGDHLGSSVLVTDETGQTVWSTEYTPFGKTAAVEGELKNAAKFTGKDFDADVNLWYFNARWYDEEVGRFISEDTVPIDPNDPFTLNFYTYVANNPINRIDPSGNSWLSDTYESVVNYLGNKGYKTNAQINNEANASKNREATAKLDANKKAQYYLDYMGFETGGVDGVMGVKSSAAIILFQYSQGLSVTGEVDTATLEKLTQCADSGITYSGIMESDVVKNWAPKASATNPNDTKNYPNGQLDTSQMTRIPTFDYGDAKVDRQAAIGWAMMVNAAVQYNKTAADSDKLNISKFAAAGPNSGFRSYAKQKEFYDLYINHNGNFACVPGTSPHGWGLAIDMNLNDPGSLGKGKGYATTNEVRWLEANGSNYGFTGFAPSADEIGSIYAETWHWNYGKLIK